MGLFTLALASTLTGPRSPGRRVRKAAPDEDDGEPARRRGHGRGSRRPDGPPTGLSTTDGPSPRRGDGPSV